MSEVSWKSTEVAEQRRKGAEARGRLMAAATNRMFEEAAVGPGMRVLELGAGTGEVAVLLSERVGPGGKVVATDVSTPMLAVARRSVQSRPNITLEVCDASAIGLPEGSFDAVVARNLLMFVDLAVALPSVRRVMRDGARFGATVWGPVAHNPFHGLALEAARAEGGWGAADVQLAQAFSRGDRVTYEAALGEAGFRDVRVHVVAATRTFANVAEAIAQVRESPIHTAPIAGLEPGRQASAWKRVEDAFAAFAKGGAVEIPTEWLVLGAGK